jgi:hypothetical protein
VAKLGASFDNLMSALSAASDGDEIEIYDSGRFEVEGFEIAAKRLTIRAIPPARPVFVNKVPAASTPFLASDSDLQLKGIEIQWASGLIPGRSLLERVGQCVVSVKGGHLVMSHCRVLANAENAGIGSFGGSVTLTNSHVFSADGSCVVWLPGDDTELAAAQTVLESQRSAIIINATTNREDDAAARLRLTNNSLISDVGINLMVDRPMRRFETVSAQNIFDTKILLRVTAARYFVRANGDSLKQSILSKLSWSETTNAYRSGVLYMKRGRIDDARPFLVLEATLAGWLASVGQPEAKSFETEFSAANRAIGSNPSDGDPFAQVRIGDTTPEHSVGASLERVGPESLHGMR